MGLRPKIRAPSCRWTTLSNSTRWAGVALLGLDWGQGSKMGPMLGVRTGTEYHKGTVVGLCGGTSAGRQASQCQVLPQPQHLTLSNLSHYLIYYQGGETVKEGS